MKGWSKTSKAILSVAFVYRVLFAFKHRQMGIDGGYFFEIAQNVASGLGLSSRLSLYHMGATPLPAPTSVYPLWPWLLGNLGKVFPLDVLAWALPTMLSIATLLLLHGLGRKLWSGKLKLGPIELGGPELAMGLYAFNPLLFIVTARPYTEALTFFLLTLAMLRLHRLEYAICKSESAVSVWRLSLEIGLLFGLSVLSRSQSIVALGALGITGFIKFLQAERMHKFRWVAAGGIIATLSSTVLVGRWWSIRQSFPDAPLTALVNFSHSTDTSPLSGLPFWVEHENLIDTLRAKLSGLAVAYNPWDTESYYWAFSIIPWLIGLLFPIGFNKQSRTEILSKLSRVSLLHCFIVVFGVLSFVSLHLAQKTYFSEWHFGRRHALPLLYSWMLLLAVGLRYSRVRLQKVLFFFICLGLLDGLRYAHWSTYRAYTKDPVYFEPSRQGLVEWLRSRQSISDRPLTVAFDHNEGQRLIWAIPKMNGRWIYWNTTLKDLELMRDTLGLDLLVSLNKDYTDKMAKGPARYRSSERAFAEAFEEIEHALEGYRVYQPRSIIKTDKQ